MNHHPPTQQHTELWAKVISSASPEGMLHMAMRHAAHNLAEMVDHPFEIKDLRIQTLPISYLTAYADNSEAETVGIYLIIGDDLAGEAILILSPADAMYLVDWLLEVRPGTTTKLGELECSALGEFGNLTLSSFLNAVSEFTNTPLRLSPPAIMVDMLATVFEAVVMSAETTTNERLVIETNFLNPESDLAIQFWVLPDPAVLATRIGDAPID
ncbi:MAG: chemotaxis protein CheC [Anaerolineae bacterium]|nr:chemotaxis protein CheC [Anaerolineae bacterium]